MVAELFEQRYAQNGIVPQAAVDEFRGIVVNKESCSDDETGRAFNSMICDCGDDGCCST